MNGIGPSGSDEVAAGWADRLLRDPSDAVARHNLGAELFRLDRPADALAELDRAWSEGLRAAETATMRGNCLVQLGRLGEAEEAYLVAIATNPSLVDAPRALAAVRPQAGKADTALEGFAAALAASPETGILWVEAMAAAKGHKDWARLLEWAAAAERRFGADTMISVFAANALAGLDRDSDAVDRLHAALAAEPDFAPAQATLAHVLIRQGDYRAAEGAALAATQLAPLDQSGWALLGTIWRLLADPREDWLCRYDAFVMVVDGDLPAALTPNLAARHAMRAQPADQSLRGGTQTPGNLFETADPLVQQVARDLRRSIEAEVLRLPVEHGHPLLERNTGAIAYSASWSVRLASEGFHVSHMHPTGWLSSALYVALPPEVAADRGEGALAFGVPDAALGLDLPPRLTVQPREGRLVLFPSYLWHGTTPFRSASPRMTVAFDMVPVDNAAASA